MWLWFVCVELLLLLFYDLDVNLFTVFFNVVQYQFWIIFFHSFWFTHFLFDFWFIERITNVCVCLIKFCFFVLFWIQSINWNWSIFGFFFWNDWRFYSILDLGFVSKWFKDPSSSYIHRRKNKSSGSKLNYE